MPPIKLERIVSCSSEDVAYPASNLLRRDGNRKWKCKERGEKVASVVIQFERPCIISGIDIGNESSAFIEVLVSRSSTPDDFQVLLVMSSFMTPMDARNETNRNRVRLFSATDLSDSVRQEKWDRVKVICTQPFNKHMQYGLSFIVLNEMDARDDVSTTPIQVSSPVQTLGRFTLKEDDDSDISIGSFFSRRKDLAEIDPPPTPSLTGAAAIREASSATALERQKTTRKKKSHDSPGSPVIAKKKKYDKDMKTPENSISKKNSETNKPLVAAKPKIPSSSSGSSTSEVTVSASDDSELRHRQNMQNQSETSSIHTKPLNRQAKVLYKPFSKLLENVEIVISGYVNPGRSEIRSRALQMGAKYKPDWVSTSTHLICAFANTPKFFQVKGKGIIVTRDWIDECYKQRKRLPWRRFAVDDADKKSPEEDSEVEIWELTQEAEEDNISNKDVASVPPVSRRNNLSVRDTRVDASSSDSEDEIERIRAEKQLKMKQRLNGKPMAASPATVRVGRESDKDKIIKEREEFTCSTDVDSDAETETLEAGWVKEQQEISCQDSLPPLPNFFLNKTFYICNSLPEEDKQALSRYIIAFGGDVCHHSIGQSVDYVLAHKKADLEMPTHISPQSLPLTPDWIWECNDKRRMVPTGQYELQ